MKLKDKVALARQLAAEWLNDFEFLNVVEDEATAELPEEIQLEIHSIITQALSSEIAGSRE